MHRFAWIISRYLVLTVLPYFASAWVLLSVILFVQQGTRYSDIFFNINIPANLAWQLTIALVPSVVAFTCPMAMLVGTIIGLTKMQGDSELIAIRAAGVGRLQIAVPIILLGIVMSAFAFVVNLEGVPLAAGLVRSVGLQAAIKKLESPIEPGVFNTDVSGYTIYVKGGDFATSTWKNIFIYQEDKPNGVVRLITSRNGRIDTTGQESEMVLEKATISTLPMNPGTGKYVSENIDGVRLAIKTRRSDLIRRLSNAEMRPEELGLEQLADYARTKQGTERTEARILWQRRILLSISPLIFCILGTLVVLRFNRGGRGFGMLMALIILVSFFLLAFLGEQLARVGTISVALSSVLPLAGSLAGVLLLAFTSVPDQIRTTAARIAFLLPKLPTKRPKLQLGNLFVDLTTGLRDFDLVRNLIKNFVLTLLFLVAIFVIFTAFEMWKFAGAFEGGVGLLGRYLTYLLPFVYLQVAPSAAMIATLATYVIKSRNNEIVTWTSAGQSVYRLLVPCFILTIALGGMNLWMQESLVPRANQLQEQTRSIIRNRGLPASQSGKFWVANERRIYSFELEASSGVHPTKARLGDNNLASDNEMESMPISSGQRSDDGRVGVSGPSAGAGSGGRSGFSPDSGLASSRAANLCDYLDGIPIQPAECPEPKYRSLRGTNDSISYMAASDNESVKVGRAIFRISGSASIGATNYAAGNERASQHRSLMLTPSVGKADRHFTAVGVRGREEAASDRLRATDLSWAGAVAETVAAIRRPIRAGNPVALESPSHREHNWLNEPTTRFTSSPVAFASDNERDGADSIRAVQNLTVYEFADNGENLQFIYRSDQAEWREGRIRFIGPVERSDLRNGKIQGEMQQGGDLPEPLNPFAGIGSKPNHVNSEGLRRQLDQVESEGDRRAIEVTLQKRYTTFLLPLVIALFTAPFALSLSRKGKAATVGYAVFLWLLFTGTSSVFEQFGVSGSLEPAVAIWSPLAIFAFLGVFLLSRVRT